jgi:segregation and condensation protein B
MRTLLTRGLVAEAGHDGESGAMLFRTTGYFLERMGLRSLDELPALAPHLPEVAELEAELSQLARPEPVPELSDSVVASTTTEADKSVEGGRNV